MKIFVKTLFSFLAALLGLLNVSCVKDDSGEVPHEGGVVALYGVLYATYDVNIVVLDENQGPIKGIKLSNDCNIVDTSYYSNENGELKVEMKTNYFNVSLLEDVDGDANGGEFQPRRLSLGDDDLSFKVISEPDKRPQSIRVNGTITMHKK